jgi:hypothetical protein
MCIYIHSQGANCSVYAAIDESLEGVGGKYLVNCRISPMAPGAKKMADAEKLWDLSIKLTGLDKELPGDTSAAAAAGEKKLLSKGKAK